MLAATAFRCVASVAIVSFAVSRRGGGGVSYRCHAFCVASRPFAVGQAITAGFVEGGAAYATICSIRCAHLVACGVSPVLALLLTFAIHRSGEACACSVISRGTAPSLVHARFFFLCGARELRARRPDASSFFRGAGFSVLAGVVRIARYGNTSGWGFHAVPLLAVRAAWSIAPGVFFFGISSQVLFDPIAQSRRTVSVRRRKLDVIHRLYLWWIAPSLWELNSVVFKSRASKLNAWFCLAYAFAWSAFLGRASAFRQAADGNTLFLAVMLFAFRASLVGSLGRKLASFSCQGWSFCCCLYSSNEKDGD